MIHELDEEMLRLMQSIEWGRITERESASFALAMAVKQGGDAKLIMSKRLFLGRFLMTLLAFACVAGALLGASAEAMLIVLAFGMLLTATWRAIVWWAEARLAKAHRANVIAELVDLRRRHGAAVDSSDADETEMIVDRLTEAAEEAATEDE